MWYATPWRCNLRGIPDLHKPNELGFENLINETVTFVKYIYVNKHLMNKTVSFVK